MTRAKIKDPDYSPDESEMKRGATQCLSTHFFKKWAIPGLFFFIFVFSIQLTVNNVQYKCLPMIGFEPLTSGFGNDRSTNWATITAQTREQLYLLRNGYLPYAHQFLVNFITFSSVKVFKLAIMVSWFARQELVRVWIPFTVEIFI